MNELGNLASLIEMLRFSEILHCVVVIYVYVESNDDEVKNSLSNQLINVV